MSPPCKAVCFLSTLIASCALSNISVLSLSNDEKVEHEGYDSLVPMSLPDGSTFYAYVEPKHTRDYSYSERNMIDVVAPNSYEQQATQKSTKKLVEIWNLSPMHLDMLDRGAVEPATSRASFQIQSTDRSVGPVENLSQVFALASPGEVICLKKSRKNECLAEFTISDDGPLVFDCNKDYSAITDYGREPECGGLHKYLPHELSRYYQILNHLKFKYGYRKLTGRNYLVGDPHAIITGGTPRNMWPADYLGQEQAAAAVTGHRGLEGDHIQNDTAMGKISMTLKVLSGKPRVFQIESFLSEEEIDYIVSVAKEEFHEDTTGKQTAVLHRPMSSVIDTICSRASDLLQVKERMTSKHFDSIVVERTIASLTDFDTASVHNDSERGVQLISKSVYMRYATLVLFLNEPRSGGELRFPLAVDHASSIPLTIPPKTASAILFYSILPDGNLDEKSIWEISNVKDGERWIATLTIAEDMNFY